MSLPSRRLECRISTLDHRSRVPGILPRPIVRANSLADLLEQNVERKSVQDLAGNADRRRTRLSDQRRGKVTRNNVERIFISGIEPARLRARG
jgi:hypothetical protein